MDSDAPTPPQGAMPGGQPVPPQQPGGGPGPQGQAGPGGPGMPGIPGLQFRGPGGAMPSPEQIQMMQRKIAEEAQKAGMTIPEYVERLKAQAMAQQRMRMAQQQQGGGPGGPGGPMPQGGPGGPPQPPPGAKPIQPGPPKPEALAVAKFLRGQNLKLRTVILNGERKDMFRVKRALRALESPAYEKARKRNPLLPEIKDRAALENTFKLLPISMLALRVRKHDPHEGHNHGKKGKRVKGQWDVIIERQQDCEDDMYYVWLWEGSQIMKKVYAGLALVAIFLVVLYPLWPLFLRQGVYYASWGLLGLLGLFFLMAIFRVILFCITYFAVPPGLWLYPNLWEDVSFMDSFRPVWAWHETTKQKKKKKNKGAAAGTGGDGSVNAAATFNAATGQPAPATATTTATATQIQTQQPTQRAVSGNYVAPRVEELPDDE